MPALRTGDVVIMDNLGSHKVAGVREVNDYVVRGEASAPLPLLGKPACRWLDGLTLANRPAVHCLGSDRLPDQANIAALQAASL